MNHRYNGHLENSDEEPLINCHELLVGTEKRIVHTLDLGQATFFVKISHLERLYAAIGEYLAAQRPEIVVVQEQNPLECNYLIPGPDGDLELCTLRLGHDGEHSAIPF